MKSTFGGLHAFEKAGLGVAPFRCLFVFSTETKEVTAGTRSGSHSASAIDGGKCALCGKRIVHNYVVESADQKRFTVGSGCAKLANDAKLTADINGMKGQGRRRKTKTVKDEAQMDLFGDLLPAM